MISRRQFLQATVLPLSLKPAQRLRFVFSRPYDNPRTQWLIKVYRDICSMSGLGFEYLDVPPKRATAMVQAGQADGELGRTFGYLTLYPRLIRLREPNNVVHFCVYGAGPEASFEGMDRLRLLHLRCEYRRGIPELEVLLAAKLAPAQLSQISDVGQGLRKLQLGRTDLYFDVQEAVEDYLAFRECNSSPPETPIIRQLAQVQSTTGHCYLNNAHASHAPHMADALAELKHNGTVMRYLQESLAQYRHRCFDAAKASDLRRQ
ncbi:hypothetical protein NHH73_22395 [Oxalobacteraceae bacterium OTU3CINTB1]|nr:hypothetical protein NHH73_22395 [Oxalobacteraceae bacterium OTU3CINTB1]